MNERPNNTGVPPQADSEGPPAADAELDATGLICPEPLMLVRNRVREMRSGQVLRVTATDPTTGRDFRDFCRFMGHALLAERRAGSTLEYWIRKA
jgi:tRNA 2-thiouridine synthesizing protein A